MGRHSPFRPLSPGRIITRIDGAGRRETLRILPAMKHRLDHLTLFMRRWWPFLFLMGMGLAAAPVQAASCSPAGAQGAAPASWQSYCWLDMTSYDNAIAASAAGQNFSYVLADGSTLSFKLKTSATAGGAFATTAPSWSGAAVGNTSFLNIAGKPILYNTDYGATVTFDITDIAIIPPPGVAVVSDYAFVVADGESTDNAEYLEYTTNGGGWELLDSVAPTSGGVYPGLTGTGTSVARSSGDGNPGPIGAHILGTNRPTSVKVEMKSGGLEGVMFAVRFASISLTKMIAGARVDPTDQFTFQIRSTSSGSVLASGTTTGTGNGPFAAAVVSTASGIAITLTEMMAAGSQSTLAHYRPSLTCVNSTGGSPTVMPTNATTTSYDFGPLRFGDIVQCSFVNTAYPHVSAEKTLASGGRYFAADQFTVQVAQGATILASATTSGAGSSVTGGKTGQIQLISGSSYQIREIAEATTVLDYYNGSLNCTNAFGGSATSMPTAIGQDFTPAMGDVITCIITNTRKPPAARMRVTKMSQVVTDGISTSHPKSIPGAVIRYTITVANEGDSPVDTDTLLITDQLPTEMAYAVANGVTLSNGSTPSGLSATPLPADRIRFSNIAGGHAPYDYTPSGAYDPVVTGISIQPSGALAASDGVNHPSFSVSFDMVIE